MSLIINNVVAITDQGNLYIAYDEDPLALKKQLGSEIIIYKNPISKFVAKLFHRALDVVINGEAYTLNKKSFEKHLKGMGLQIPDFKKLHGSDYSSFVEFEEINKNSLKTPLSEVISKEKKAQLSIELIKAINSEMTDKAIELINLGADLNRLIYMRKKKSNIEFTVSPKEFGADFAKLRTTALALAVFKKNKELYQFIYNAKNKDIQRDRINELGLFSLEKGLVLMPKKTWSVIKSHDQYNDVILELNLRDEMN